MNIDLTGRVAIVTGGGRGIGHTIARTLAAEGVVTVIADARQDLLEDVGKLWAAQDWPGAQMLCDVRDKTQCLTLAAEVEARFGAIDILVNNAGVAGGGRAEALAEEAWDANLDVNLKGTFLMCQAAIPAMKR